jgi:feruloyl esterase
MSCAARAAKTMGVSLKGRNMEADRSKRGRSPLLALLAGAGVVLGGLLAAASPAAATPPTPGANCTTEFIQTNLANVATTANPDPNVSPFLPLSATWVPAAGNVPAYCDIKGTLVTGNAVGDPDGYYNGAAQFELQLPGTWNSKLVYWGVGGAAGGAESDFSANPLDAAEALTLGYATAISDSGHEGSDLNFAVLLDPTVAVDYFYRATHDLTVAVKAFLPTYYSASLARAYFDGCSNGGRMAMKEASQFPDDFDGVIAGSSYIETIANAGGVKGAKALLADDGFIPPALVPVIDAAVYQYCDGIDGQVDGLIQNPMRCNATPVLQSLACPNNAPYCLTPGQIAYLKVYWGPLTTQAGALVFPGLSFTDLSATGFSYIDGGLIPPIPADARLGEPWGSYTDSPIGWVFVDTMIKAVEGNINYDTLNFPVTPGTAGGVISTAALNLYHSKTGPGDANNPASFLPFLQKGGKIIMYHGFSDPLVSPYPSILLYQQVAQLVGGYVSTQKSFRLFMEPGMGHCGGGPGPNFFETLSKLDAWVENGTAPDAILATKYNSDNPLDGVYRTMPLCKYPEEAHYNGSGSILSASNWSCPAYDTSLLEVGPVGVAAGMSLPH